MDIKVTTTVEIVDGTGIPGMKVGRTYSVSSMANAGDKRWTANETAQTAAEQIQEVLRRLEEDYGKCPQGRVAVVSRHEKE